MTPSELAAKMLEWEKGKRALDALSAEIEAEVITLQKTQVVGNVRVRYSDGRATYDYALSASNAPADLVEKHTTYEEVVDWNAVADAAPEIVKRFTTVEKHVDYAAVVKEGGYEKVILSKTAPTATIKLEG